MATYIKTLSDKDGNTILPKSRSTAIYCDDNFTVETHICNLWFYKLTRNGWQGSDSTVDFNYILNDGIYEFQGISINAPTGSTTDSHWWLEVFRHNDIWVRQIAHDVRTYQMYMRCMINGTWYGWSTVLTTANTWIRKETSIPTYLSDSEIVLVYQP